MKQHKKALALFGGVALVLLLGALALLCLFQIFVVGVCRTVVIRMFLRKGMARLAFSRAFRSAWKVTSSKR